MPISSPSIGARRFLFAVPNHRRDLEGHALVAYHLSRRFGHEVTFCNVPGLEEAVLAEAPDVVVLDRVDLRADVARLAKSLGMKVALLPTVGFTQEGTESEALRAGKNLSGERLVDCCLVWGDHGRDMVVDAALPAGVVHAVGCPRFDVYSEPYLSLAEPRQRLLGDIGVERLRAPLIVWVTNTYHVNTTHLENAVAAAVLAGVQEAEIRGQLADEGTAFSDLADATTELARRHPDWNFLIKLHPAEVPEPYRAIAERMPNIALAADARIRDVLHNCTALLANTSTTATEAWMLGKPVYEVMFGSYLIPTPTGYTQGNQVVRNVDDLDRLLQRCVQSSAEAVSDEQQRARAAFLQRVYYRIDGKASERCAILLHELARTAAHSNGRSTRIRAAASSAHAAWRRAADRRPARRIKAALGLTDEVTVRVWTRAFWRQLAGATQRTAWDEPITDAMVQEHFDRFDRAHGRCADECYRTVTGG